MIDREKIIKGIHQHCEGSMFDRCGECPYYEIDHEPFACRDMLLNDLNELLKEREAVKPVNVRWEMGINGGNCPKCMNWVQRTYSYCPFCGQAVKWE